jgi:hypothetical protein
MVFLMDLPEEILYIIAMMCVEMFGFEISGNRFTCAFSTALQLTCRQMYRIMLGTYGPNVIRIPRTVRDPQQFLDYLFASPILAPHLIPPDRAIKKIKASFLIYPDRHQQTPVYHYQAHLRYLVVPNIYKYIFHLEELPMIIRVIYCILSNMKGGVDILRVNIRYQHRMNPFYGLIIVQCCTELGIHLEPITFDQYPYHPVRERVEQALENNHRILA